MVSIIVFLLLFAAILLAIVLVAAGLLAIPLSLCAMSGFFANVTSDLSPPAMLLCGISCVSAGLALALAVIILFPKQPYMFKKEL